MSIKDEVPPFEHGGKDGENSPAPEAQSLPESPDLDGGELSGTNEPVPVEAATQPFTKPETPQKKKSSGNTFLFFFLILVFAGLAAAVYFLEEQRSNTVHAIQEKLARLDSQVGVLLAEDSTQPARDIARLQQELQAFKEEVSQTLASRPSPIEEPLPAGGMPAGEDQAATPAGEDQAATMIPDTAPQKALEPSPDLQASLTEATAESFPAGMDGGEPPPAVTYQEPRRRTQSLPPPQTDDPLERHLERSKEAQKYIDFVESTAAQLFELVKKGSGAVWDSLVDLLG